MPINILFRRKKENNWQGIKVYSYPPTQNFSFFFNFTSAQTKSKFMDPNPGANLTIHHLTAYQLLSKAHLDESIFRSRDWRIFAISKSATSNKHASLWELNPRFILRPFFPPPGVAWIFLIQETSKHRNSIASRYGHCACQHMASGES